MADAEKNEKIITGISGSPGICIGKAYLVDREGVNVIEKYYIRKEKLNDEVKRFKAAVKSGKDELAAIIEGTPEELRQHVGILETHMALYKDKMLYGRTIETIETEMVNAEWALKKIVSSVKDMVKYIKLQLGETDLISKESLYALHTPQLEYAPGRNIALTFWVDDHRAARSMGHSGGTVGQQALLTIVPEHEFGVMIGTNCATGAVAKYQIADTAIKEYLGVETPVPELLEMTGEALQEYTGEYEAKLSAVKIEAGDGELLISQKYLGGFPTADDKPDETEYGEPARFGFYAQDHIKGLDETNNTSIAQFVRENGKVTMIRSGMRLHKRIQ